LKNWKETKPEIEEEDKKLINSLNILKIRHFDRSLWNIFNQYLSRTNNISETYNHQINGGQVIAPNSNVYKMLDVLCKQETLIGN